MITRRQVLRRGSVVGAARLVSQDSSALADVTPTSVKTSNYTAAPGDFVPVDASAGSVTITLPAAPADQSQVGAKVIVIAVPSVVIVACGGSDVLNLAGGPSSLTLASLNQGILAQYQASTGIWYVEASVVSLDVARGAAQLGTDGTVGGPSGSAMSPAVALVSAPNLFVPATDAQSSITIQPHAKTQTASTFVVADSSGHPRVEVTALGKLYVHDDLGNDVDTNQPGMRIYTKWHALAAQHSVDWSSLSNAGNDLIDEVHTSHGDALFITHVGGQVPTHSFTANSDGSDVLKSVSDFAGLTFQVPIHGPGVPSGTEVVGYNVQAATLTLTNPIPAGSGLTFSYLAPTDAGTGGDTCVNLIVPYWLDHPSGNATSAPPGGVLNNRTGQTPIFVQVQPVGTGQAAIDVYSQTNNNAVKILNQFTSGGSIPANGSAPGLLVANYSKGHGIIVCQNVQLNASSAALCMTDFSGLSNTMVRVNDSSGKAGFMMLSDGTFQAGQRPSSRTPRATVRDYVSGVSQTLLLLNSGATSTNQAGDGTQLIFGIAAGGHLAARIQGVMDAIAPGYLGSLRFLVQNGRNDVEQMRLSAAGVGFFTQVTSPAPQQRSTGETSGYAAGTDVAVTIDGTFKGSAGSTAYTIGDIVTALKAYGLLVS